MLGSGESIKITPVSYPIRNFTSVSQDHIDQSTGDTVIILEQSRTLSSRHMTKVKESRMAGCPLRVFPIDISPTKKTPLRGMEHTPTGQHTSYTSAKESSPGNDDILLAERPEEHLLSFAGNTSERIICYQPTSPHSPPCFGRSQAPGTVCTGNINSTQTSQAHSLPVSQSQTSDQLITSPETTNKRPVVLTEQMQLDDLQCRTSPRSSIHLSCQHHPNIASTHVSGFKHQPDQQERAGVRVYESSERMSVSLQSQPQSEITFSSSTSTGSWPLFQRSSACGSEAPGPISTAQKQASVRPLSISKSLEDLATLPSNERWKNDPRSGIIQTVEEAPHSLSIAVLDPEQMKRLSVSVPAFIHEQDNGRESDCLSVNSFYSERQRKSSTNTNASASSGLASMSSVSGSVTNIYGTDFGNVEVKGTIQFAIDYVNKLGEFHIFIVQCRDLAVAEPKRNRSDPYVKCYLLPDKAKLGKRKTSVKKKTLNPTYNEILRYKIPLESLKVHTLNISVWHNDIFGRNSFLGEVNMDLSEWDNNSHMIDRILKGRTVTPYSPKHASLNMDMCGDMRISLRFLLQTSQSNKTPQTGEIQVWVKECTNLISIRRPIDPFVKCSILPDSHQKKRQKTRVVKRTTNPVFNHTMVYEGLRPEDLRDTCVELTVWSHDRLSNHFLGGTRLNLGTGKSHGTEVKWMDSNSAESALWRRMIESTNQWVEETVPLRMLIMAR
ncbi:synaptotagmin-like protein 2 isoform X1 [Hemibagrus wyckioides]|uniref:synaptotagmin-like protein 2 isoform X1 n=1 Tax=Hemibagrus wyckioides TaxID=337641 RepID=UPI00266C1A9C|nr:synaptotagmin-like protein 2 isoform X1 [Hemibagrus wyckioides]